MKGELDTDSSYGDEWAKKLGVSLLKEYYAELYNFDQVDVAVVFSDTLKELDRSGVDFRVIVGKQEVSRGSIRVRRPAENYRTAVLRNHPHTITLRTERRFGAAQADHLSGDDDLYIVPDENGNLKWAILSTLTYLRDCFRAGLRDRKYPRDVLSDLMLATQNNYRCDGCGGYQHFKEGENENIYHQSDGTKYWDIPVGFLEAREAVKHIWWNKK